MSLGMRIREQRKRCGFSQEKLAEEMGVSRQAVTKWENDRSAPSTENLFRLAELFHTTVDLLLPEEKTPQPTVAEELYALYREEEQKKLADRKEKRKKNLLCGGVVAAGYAVLYLLGRVFAPALEEMSIMGWLFTTDPQQLPYLYGWLVKQGWFFIAAALSAPAALLGKRCFAAATLIGFTAGLLCGELFGEYPAGVALGQGHYGWLIWGIFFLLSMVVGGILEKRGKR